MFNMQQKLITVYAWHIIYTDNIFIKTGGNLYLQNIGLLKLKLTVSVD